MTTTLRIELSSPRPLPNKSGEVQSDPSLQRLDPRLEALNDIANMADFIELPFQLVNLAQDLVKTRDLGIGHLHRAHGGGRLSLDGDLGLVVQL